MSTLNSEMSQMQQQQVIDANNAGVASGGGLTTTHANNNSVASDSGIESSAASISSLGGASNSNASSTTSPHIANNNNNKTNEKNTVSAAADSSDNQPSTPQPQNEAPQQPQPQQQQQQQLQPILHQPYAGTAHENTQQHQMYANTTNNAFPHTMYANGMYNAADQQHQPQQQNYGNFIPNFDNYYQQQPQGQQQQNFANNSSNNSTTLMFNNNNHNHNNSDYKRYHPYAMGSGSDLSNDNNNKQHQLPTTILSNNNAVSTTRNISPNLVSSSSPTSTSVHMQHYGTAVSGTPNSPSGNNRQCKKCGIMCSSESELQEHVSNVHGSSPYGSSSGYSSSPFIKEEAGVISTASTNTGDILDLDSQKMVYPHELTTEQHENVALHENPLHSMHTMQQRALPAWEQQTTVVPPTGLPIYYANKQNLPAFSAEIKQEFMKPEYPDSQEFVDNVVANVNDISQQQQQNTVMSIASPVEFPSTTTSDLSQDAQQKQSQQQTFRNPPTNTANMGNNSSTSSSKAAAWKSNEARRPKTYNCTACNKWFTSSGHLKRHYNTTLHKNAVKSSNQPDPATMPISVHHHPARDPNSKHNRRNSQQAQQQQQQQQQQAVIATSTVPVSETPVSPTDYTSVSSQSAAHMSNYSASPSPTQNGYQHQFIQQQQQQTSNISPILSGVASPTTSNGSSNNLNGHPNALAGPSVPITSTTLGTTMSSSQMRGLLNTTIINWLKNETSTEEEDATLDQVMGVQHMDQEQQQQQPQRQQQPQQLEQTDQLEHVEQEQQQQEYLSAQEQDQLVHYHTTNTTSNNNNIIINNNSNNNNNSTKLISTHTICHQSYLEQQQQQQHQQMVDSTYSAITPTQSPQLQQQQQQLVHMQVPQDIIQHLDININNMQQQQQPYITHIATTAVHPMDMQQRLESPVVLEEELQAQQPQQQQQLPVGLHLVKTETEVMEMQLEEHQQQQQLQQQQQQQQVEEHHQQVLPSMPHCHTLLNNTSLEGLDNMLTHTPINMQQQQHMQRIINMHTMLPLTTITAQQLQPQHTHTPLLQPHTTNTTTTTIPCFQQLQQQAVASLSASPALVPLEPTMTYHTIIGNSTRYNHNNNNNNNNQNNLDQLQQEQTVNGNEYLQLSNGFESYATQSGLPQQLMANNDIQILQLVSTNPQTSYITFPQQQQQHNHNDNDENNAHLLTYTNGFVPIENMQTSEQIRADSLETIEHKPELYALDNNNEHDNDNENYEVEQLLLVGKKKTLKRKRRATKAKVISVVKIESEELEHLEQQQLNPDETLPAVGKAPPADRITCPECPKTFTKPCYLTQHMKIHAGKCPFRCTKCGKRYKVEEVFKEHVARHGSTNKPHKCHTCEKQFHHKTDLRRHIEVIHKNEKKHVCHICPKGFCRNDHLLKHIETHFRARIAKDAKDATKDPKIIQPRKQAKRTSSTSTSSANSINFEQNETTNLPKNVQQKIQVKNPNTNTNPNTNEQTDSSDDPSPLVAIDEDEVELLQIANHHQLMLTQQQLSHPAFQMHPFRFREISLF